MFEPLEGHIDFRKLLSFHREYLLNNVVPFWMTFGFRGNREGIDSCLADDGTVLSTDRYMWSQLRAIWTFSALYNRIEKRDCWLDLSGRIYSFARKFGRDANGQWCFRVSADGEILEGPTSIYSDGFAIYGLTEFYKATGERQALDLAMETFETVLPRLDDWEKLQ